MVVFWNILWTEKAMGQKNGHGSPEVTSLIPRCCKPFTPLIQIVRDLEGEADHHDVGVLSPQEWAVEEGVVSQIGQALPPPNHNDHLHRSINCLSHCNHLSGINHHHQDTFISTHTALTSVAYTISMWILSLLIIRVVCYLQSPFHDLLWNKVIYYINTITFPLPVTLTCHYHPPQLLSINIIVSYPLSESFRNYSILFEYNM